MILILNAQTRSFNYPNIYVQFGWEGAGITKNFIKWALKEEIIYVGRKKRRQRDRFKWANNNYSSVEATKGVAEHDISRIWTFV